jgi:hypothetical protein
MLSIVGTVLLPAMLGLVPDDPPKPPEPSEFLVIPLRVHVLTAEGLPEVDCKLADEDIRRIVGKVNGVWNAAGIHFGLESIVREPAAKQDRFRAFRDLAGDDGPVPLNAFRLLMPDASRSKEGMDVYYIHKFAVNGVYLGDRVAFVQETAKLREVEGGIDEPIPRVTAHELGHALGLPHRQARTNLLASGTTGTSLNASEIEKAREIAKKVPGVLTRGDLEAKAEADAEPESDAKRSETLRRWLAEISKPEKASAEKAEGGAR